MQLRFVHLQRFTTVMSSPRRKSDSEAPTSQLAGNCSKQKKNSKKQSKKQSEIIKWPSKHHSVVCFRHTNANLLDVNALTKHIGTIKKQLVITNKPNLIITKVEMSTSFEAEEVWKKFSGNLPPGIFSIEPDQFKTISSHEHSRKRNNSYNSNQKKPQFSEYMTMEKVHEGVKNRTILCGQIRINSKKFTHAFISDEDGRDILIDGLKDRNRALEGDEVAVQINDASKWVVGKTSSVGSVEDAANGIEKLDISNSNSQTKFKHSRKTGKVVAILKYKNSRCTTGHIKVHGIKNMRSNMVFFSPLSSTFPRLFLPRASFANHLSNPDLHKILFVAKFKEWSIYENIPVGELCEMIGKEGNVEAETRRILIDHDIDSSEFPPEVVDCLPSDMSSVFSDSEKVKRRDFTKECVFTIDPATAKDLDDALHCKVLPDGNFEVGVHIADVSHFVKLSSAVDKIASKRCTSVYLVQKVIPMLPNILCEELCSLNPATERFSFSVVWTISEKGEILSEWFGKSIIRSCAKLSYDHAQSFIDNPTRDFSHPETSPKELEFPEVVDGYDLDVIRSKVLVLHKISMNLRRQRFENGALRLDQVRLSYTLSADGLPTGCYAFERKASNELIEEFMLLANMAVAHKIYKAMPEHAFLRSHPSPKETMMEDFVAHCKAVGLDIDSSSSQSLAASINTACGNDHLATFRKQALFVFAIKPQQLATYVCAGSNTDPASYHHYALNVPLYTHFTSPIRRYADVIVHRQLAVALGLEGVDIEASVETEDLQSQAQLCNDRKYKAKIAGEVSVELFFNLLVVNYGPLECNGMIMHVYDRSVDVLSMEYGVVKRVYVDAIPGVCFKFEEKLTENGGKTASLKLKWLKDNKEVERRSGDPPLLYDEQAQGIVQTLEIFKVVKIILQKQEPDSVVLTKAILKAPTFCSPAI